jgi:hypothetical protein
MPEETRPGPLIWITLFMIFISGCWTLATIVPFPLAWPTRAVQLAVVTVSNISFLVSLLASMLYQGEMIERETARRWSIIFFAVGITALIVSILLFSASYLVKPPYYID